MTATLCIAATLHSGNPQGRKLIKHLLEDAPRPFRGCYIGAAHDDDRSWAKVTLDFFKDEFGVKLAAPRLSDPKLDVAEAREAIETAQVLYLDGGDTVQCVQHAQARGLAGSFKKAAKKAFLSYGLSGGACAMPPYTIGYGEKDEPYVAPCFDMGAPYPVDVHDEQNDWPEMRALLELVEKDKKHGEACGVVIPTGAAFIVRPDGTLASWGKTACEKRRLAKNGSWKIEKIPLV